MARHRRSAVPFGTGGAGRMSLAGEQTCRDVRKTSRFTGPKTMSARNSRRRTTRRHPAGVDDGACRQLPPEQPLALPAPDADAVACADAAAGVEGEADGEVGDVVVNIGVVMTTPRSLAS